MVPCAQCWKPCTAQLVWKNPSAEEQQVRGFVMMVYVACSVLLCSSLRGGPELSSAPTCNLLSKFCFKVQSSSHASGNQQTRRVSAYGLFDSAHQSQLTPLRGEACTAVVPPNLVRTIERGSYGAVTSDA